MLIKTPFLKWMFQFYGNLSVQLYPLYLSNWHSLLNGFWNISLTFLVSAIMTTFSDDNFFSDHIANEQMRRLFAEKPLFSILMKVVMRHIFPICYLLIMPYFVLINLNNRRLLVLMDAFSELAPPINKQRFELFLGGVLFHLVVYASTIYPMVQMLVPNLSFSPKVAILYFIFFTMNVNCNISFILTNYYKFATKITLEQTMADFEQSQNLGKFADRDNLKRLMVKLSRLAVVSRQLNSLLSFPLLFNILPYIAQILATFSTVGVQNDNLPNGSYLVQFAMPMSYICHTEWCIQRQLNQLDRLVRLVVFGTGTGKQNTFWVDQTQKYNSLGSGKVFKFHQNHQNPLWPSLQCAELVGVYRGYFKLKVFDACTINWTFLGYIILFVVNYAVLITQTSV